MVQYGNQSDIQEELEYPGLDSKGAMRQYRTSYVFEQDLAKNHHFWKNLLII